MREYTAQIDCTQLHNTCQMLPSLSVNGFGTQLLEIEQPKAKKHRKQEPPTCSVCHLPYVYDHIA